MQDQNKFSVNSEKNVKLRNLFEPKEANLKIKNNSIFYYIEKSVLFFILLGCYN